MPATTMTNAARAARLLPLPLALLLALAGAASAEVLLDQVKWQAEYGVPTAAGLAGRCETVFLFRGDDAAAKKAYERWVSVVRTTESDQPGLAALAVGVEADFGKPGKKGVERLARGNDSGGLLRAFAGGQPAVMLVFGSDGRLTELRAAAAVDGKWIHALEKQAATATPLIDSGWIPAALRPALPWYLAADTKRFVEAADKLKGGEALGPYLAKRTLEQAGADAAIVGNAALAGAARLIAWQRLQGMAAEFPGVAGDCQAAAKSVKDDAVLKAELAGWAAFTAYLETMADGKGKTTAAEQTKLLKSLVAAHPGTYAEEIALKIAAFAALELK